MRRLLPGLMATLTLAMGCQWMRNSRVEPRPTTPTSKSELQERQPAEFVAYLNQQANLLQTVVYDDVRAVASENGKDIGTLSDSSVYCAKPRNFRMIGGHSVLGTMIDIGSNDREFWMYAKPLGRDNYFYCSHDAFASGQVRFPIPFDSDWVLQAVGMAEYQSSPEDEIRTSAERQQYALIQKTRTRAGVPVLKSTVFSAEPDGTRVPTVVKHTIHDASANPPRKLATAEVLGVKTVTLNGRNVEVPTDVLLEWPEQKFKMTLKLSGIKVNDSLDADRAAKLFNKPRINGSQPIDLARYQFVTPTNYRAQFQRP
jgi:hypothetical protein